MTTKKLKIVFIQPINTETLGIDILCQKTTEVNFYAHVSTAFGYLKSYADKYPGNDIFEYKLVYTLDELLKEKFDILGVSAYTPYFYHAVKIIEAARNANPDALIILGGYHITSLPSNLPEDADVGVIGEGEEPFAQLLDLYLKTSSRKEFKDNLNNIKGIVYKDKGRLIKTEPCKLINPLDVIPICDKTLSVPMKIPVIQYNSNYTAFTDLVYKDGVRALNVITSRGCPFRCSFCTASLAFEQKFREFTSQYVINEIEQIMETFPDVRYIRLTDDLFGFDRKRLNELADEFETRQINKKIAFGCVIRADLVDEELCILLKRLNIKDISFGAESGSERVLGILKDGVTVQDNQRACRLLTKYGIGVACTLVLGTPSETEEELQESFDFIINNMIEGCLSSPHIAILTPFPGTVWWDYAKEQGWVDENNMNWTRLDNMFMSCFPQGSYTFEEWRASRENYSIYMNKYTIPEKRFYDLLAKFNEKLTAIFKARKSGRII